MNTFLQKTLKVGLILACCGVAPIAFAHVIVSPNQAAGSSYETFTMAVPSEIDAATVNIKLLVPAGLTDVAPNVKPGWNITLQKTGSTVTSITWSAGSIPSGFRDQFSFSAKTPAQGTLMWKAYQTYNDGTLVSWDNPPVAASSAGTDDDNDAATHGPYSQTVLSGTGSGLMMDMDSSMGMMAMSPDQHAQHIIIFLVLLALGFSLGCVYQISKIEQKLNKK